MKNQRDDEDASISDNIPISMDPRGNTTRNIMTSLDLRGNTTRMQVRLVATPASQRKEHCKAKYSYFKIPYENH